MAAATTTGTAPRTIHVAELPSARNMIFRDSSFFKEHGHDLPSPKEIREKDIEVNSFRARSPRPPPILFEELGLVVKYGSAITIAEAQCLWYFNKYMKDAVPTPELYGWCHDDGETFIYMEFVNADTLEDVWPSLNQEDQNIICEQLRTFVEAWRSLRQETEPYYVGHIGHQGVGDIIFSDAGDPHAGPFEDITQFHDFFARYSCRLQPDWNPRRDFPELAGLADDRPIVFTHGDLDRSNILVFPRDGESPPRVAAIIDWHQSGWYPCDWEWLKAESRCDAFWEGGRDTAWLLRIMTPADKDYQVAWEFIMRSLGF
ncbi:kinase-like domain-containing protein [Daldinia vernicosa]|uniref:kinase-like domain-containing protein n=1 Tax=Daldinia vernicosa TaxID=114800 RepID=UPI0020088726|nr:kinase-like domain-containing protein [Daldinia vernicosa]KAI0853605.1 kinase-like domain-containing protein [Daldinia vernicosa]